MTREHSPLMMAAGRRDRGHVVVAHERAIDDDLKLLKSHVRGAAKTVKQIGRDARTGEFLVASRFKFQGTTLEDIVVLLQAGPATAVELQDALRKRGTEASASTVLRALVSLVGKHLVRTSLTTADVADARAELAEQQQWAERPEGDLPAQRTEPRKPTVFTLTEEGQHLAKLALMRSRLEDILPKAQHSWMTKAFREIYNSASHLASR